MDQRGDQSDRTKEAALPRHPPCTAKPGRNLPSASYTAPPPVASDILRPHRCLNPHPATFFALPPALLLASSPGSEWTCAVSPTGPLCCSCPRRTSLAAGSGLRFRKGGWRVVRRGWRGYARRPPRSTGQTFSCPWPPVNLSMEV